jgi:cytochrome c551/c552
VGGTTAEEIIANVGCTACHTIEAIGATGTVGPDLSFVGDRLTPEEIRQSILTPNAVIAEACPQLDEEGNVASTGACPEGIMPPGLGDRLSGMQLETVVAFLSDLKE